MEADPGAGHDDARSGRGRHRDLHRAGAGQRVPLPSSRAAGRAGQQYGRRTGKRSVAADDVAGACGDAEVSPGSLASPAHSGQRTPGVGTGRRGIRRECGPVIPAEHRDDPPGRGRHLGHAGAPRADPVPLSAAIVGCPQAWSEGPAISLIREYDLAHGVRRRNNRQSRSSGILVCPRGRRGWHRRPVPACVNGPAQHDAGSVRRGQAEQPARRAGHERRRYRGNRPAVQRHGGAGRGGRAHGRRRVPGAGTGGQHGHADDHDHRRPHNQGIHTSRTPP